MVRRWLNGGTVEWMVDGGWWMGRCGGFPTAYVAVAGRICNIEDIRYTYIYDVR